MFTSWWVRGAVCLLHTPDAREGRTEFTIAQDETLVITLAAIDSYLIFLALTAAATALEHMAFRTPKWRRREFVRRLIGIETVLGLFLLVVWSGDADLVTWAMVQGGFVVAGSVKLGAAYLDGLRSGHLLDQVMQDADTAQNS